MSNLENLVPPVELCRMIPAGEFGDSTLVYRFDHQQAGKMFPETNEDERFFYVEEREMVEFAQRNMVNPPPMFPAPTLEEILAKLRDITEQPGVYCGRITGLFVCDSKEFLTPIKDKSGAAAALRLWFKVKGVKIEI